jgi:hypothetical protein
LRTARTYQQEETVTVAGEKCRLRQDESGLWEVEIARDRWRTCASQSDAELIAAAGLLMCEQNPSQGLLRRTIAAMDRNGMSAKDLVYRFLIDKVKEEDLW